MSRVQNTLALLRAERWTAIAGAFAALGYVCVVARFSETVALLLAETSTGWLLASGLVVGALGAGSAAWWRNRERLRAPVSVETAPKLSPDQIADID